MYVKWAWYIERMYPGSIPHSLVPYVKRAIVLYHKQIHIENNILYILLKCEIELEGNSLLRMWCIVVHVNIKAYTVGRVLIA